jgi:hypothetical protein
MEWVDVEGEFIRDLVGELSLCANGTGKEFPMDDYG